MKPDLTVAQARLAVIFESGDEKLIQIVSDMLQLVALTLSRREPKKGE